MDSLSAIEIDKILDIASKMKKILISDYKKTSYLRGKSIVNLFFENSTRTRSSFELAGKYLGADVINISKSGSSMTKGESVKDTLLTMAAVFPPCMRITVLYWFMPDKVWLKDRWWHARGLPAM